MFDEQRCQHGYYLIHREEDLLLFAGLQSCFISISVDWVLIREVLCLLCVYMEVVCYGSVSLWVAGCVESVTSVPSVCVCVRVRVRVCVSALYTETGSD